MVGSVNKAILVGNVGKDPEIRTMQSGGKVASFSLATSKRWTDKTTGEKQEKTEWHRIAIFSEQLVSVTERFIKKGTKLYVEGSIETRKWTDQSGQDRYTTEVVLRPYNGELVILDTANRHGSSAEGENHVDTGTHAGVKTGTSNLATELNDDIPF